MRRHMPALGAHNGRRGANKIEGMKAYFARRARGGRLISGRKGAGALFGAAKAGFSLTGAVIGAGVHLGRELVRFFPTGGFLPHVAVAALLFFACFFAAVRVRKAVRRLCGRPAGGVRAARKVDARGAACRLLHHLRQHCWRGCPLWRRNARAWCGALPVRSVRRGVRVRARACGHARAVCRQPRARARDPALPRRVRRGAGNCGVRAARRRGGRMDGACPHSLVRCDESLSRRARRVRSGRAERKERGRRRGALSRRGWSGSGLRSVLANIGAAGDALYAEMPFLRAVGAEGVAGALFAAVSACGIFTTLIASYYPLHGAPAGQSARAAAARAALRGHVPLSLLGLSASCALCTRSWARRGCSFSSPAPFRCAVYFLTSAFSASATSAYMPAASTHRITVAAITRSKRNTCPP